MHHFTHPFQSTHLTDAIHDLHVMGSAKLGHKGLVERQHKDIFQHESVRNESPK
jgi:hypothetical protein